IATPQSIAERLTECLADADPPLERPEDQDPLLLTRTIQGLKDATGVDFSQYKESTLRRQLQRRLVVTGLATMEAYVERLATDSDEARALMQNLLVTVTAFFRNLEAFEELKRWLTPLVKEARWPRPFRVWVPGCATGEEAYTIAMIISEILDHPEQLSSVLKIFATDLDEASLMIARRATYPNSAAVTIPADLRQRFTRAKGDQVEITKDLRACIIFARHNICEDPPFPDIRLVSCRNLLIYFTPALQEQVVSMLSFSLQPGGLLFLGGSESLGQMPGFHLLNPVFRLYERTQNADSRYRLATLLGQRKASKEPAPTVAINERESLPTQHLQLLEALIRVFAKPSLVLDDTHHLVEVIGDVSPFCQMPQGRLTNAAISFLRDELKAEARALFLLARAGRSPVRSGRLQLADRSHPLRLEASTLRVGDQDLTLLSFVEDADLEPEQARFAPSERNTILAQEIERLEKELLASQETLRRSLLHLEQTNEELEASSEELQATNDETALLNQQLRVRGDELEKLNTDLENIQRSLNQGMVIVDQDLRVTLFSPLAVRVFGLVAEDVGHPLIGIPTTVPIQGLRAALLAVIHEGRSCNLQAISEENSYWLQLMPYRNSASVILGAIMTMTDISELVALRRVAEASLLEFERLTDALDPVVWKRDVLSGKILYISARIQHLTGWKASEVAALPDLLDSAMEPEERAAVQAARAAGLEGWSIAYSFTRRDGQRRTLREVAIPLRDASSDHAVVGTLSDITDQERQTRQLAGLRDAWHTLIRRDPHPTALLAGSGRAVLINRPLARLVPDLALADGEDTSLHPLTRRLVPLDSSLPHDATWLESTLQAMARKPQAESDAPLRLAVTWAAGPRAAAFTLELVPLPVEPDAPGWLLRLRDPGAVQGQSSSVPPATG
ncbi:MAG: CheR family methyltransferase, partial [Cyanobacteriota bacterium]|nr:CheR family methyltransferase [Cyanobacteriota bacterium]